MHANTVSPFAGISMLQAAKTKRKEKWADCTICTSLPRWYL